MNGRHRGAEQGRTGSALWVTQLILVIVVPLGGVIALLVWLSAGATPREMWAGTGLVMLYAAVRTFIRDSGRSSSRWTAAAQAAVAIALFIDAAAPRHMPLAYTVASDCIAAIATACLGAPVALAVRSGELRFPRPSWLRRDSSAPG